MAMWELRSRKHKQSLVANLGIIQRYVIGKLVVRIHSWAQKIKNMRRFIYDLYYADEITEDLCIKLIEKLNEVSEKRRKKRGSY